MADTKKFLDYDGLLYYHGKVKNQLSNKVDKESGKGLSTNDYTTAEKEKLAGLENYTLPIATSSALGGIKVGKGLAINTATGVLDATGTEVQIDEALSDTSTNPVQNKVVKAAIDNKVTKETGKGLSTNDYTTAEKDKLNGIAEGAEVNQNAYSSITDGTTTINAGSKTSTLTMTGTGATTVSVSGSTVTINSKNTEYSDATTSVHGLMTAADKEKLDGIEEGATKTTIDSNLSSTSTNPVQNKVINTALSNKVDKVSGKDLSTNDYTTAEKNKLADIAEGAQVNIIESIKVNGTAQTITNKAVDITVPTNNNQLTNGAGYQTSTEVQTAINDAIKDITGIDFQVVTELPTTGVKGTIYLILNGGSTTQNIYDEYIWLSSSSSYEKIGTTEVDLSNYWNTTNLIAITNGEIDTIVATN